MCVNIIYMKSRRITYLEHISLQSRRGKIDKIQITDVTDVVESGFRESSLE